MEMQTTIVVDSLASHGAGLNAKDETGVTPLMSAARSDQKNGGYYIHEYYHHDQVWPHRVCQDSAEERRPAPGQGSQGADCSAPRCQELPGQL